jgi:hypothetical protein
MLANCDYLQNQKLTYYAGGLALGSMYPKGRNKFTIGNRTVCNGNLRAIHQLIHRRRRTKISAAEGSSQLQIPHEFEIEVHPAG